VAGKGGRPEKGPPPADDKGPECWFCHEKGHTRGPRCKLLQGAATYFQKNPVEDFIKQVKEGGFVTITGLDRVVMTVGSTLPFGPYAVNIDNQASLSVFHNQNMLTNLRKTNKIVRIAEVGKAELVVDIVGDFMGIAEVYWHPDCVANLLCFADMHKKYGVKFSNNSFSFKAKGNQFNFHIDGKFYICNMEKFFRKAEVFIATDPEITVAISSEVTLEAALVETVSQNLSKFTKREVERAEEARKLFSVLGRPSVKDFIRRSEIIS
jgi:hypothetical protein